MTTRKTVNIIDICTEKNQRVYYAWENGKWTKNFETKGLESGVLETTTVSMACTAEDVIEDLLNNICREGVRIDTYRRYGTPFGVQLWSTRDEDKGPSRLSGDPKIELESLRTRNRWRNR